VSYQAQFEGQALVQLKGLPQAAFDALVEHVAAGIEDQESARKYVPDVILRWRV